MDELFSLLNVGSSGAGYSLIKSTLPDEALYASALKIDDVTKKINFLNDNLTEQTQGYIISKRYLAELIHHNDPARASILLLTAIRDSVLDINNYLLLANIAIEHKAWQQAKAGLEIAQMLLESNDEVNSKKIDSSLKLVFQKILNKEEDNTINIFGIFQLFDNQLIDRHWVLEQLSYKLEIEKIEKYAFKLLNTSSIDMDNYKVVYKIFSLPGNEKLFCRFINYLKEKKELITEYRDLFLGLAYYGMSEYKLSVKYLETLLERNFNVNEVSIYLALNYLILHRINDFKSVISKIEPITDSSYAALYAALYFIYCADLQVKLEGNEFPNQKSISKEITMIIDKLLKHNQEEFVNFLINRFEELNFHLIFPYLNLYLSEMYIKKKQLDKAKKLLKNSQDPEKHRLFSWIYRLEGKEDLAREALIEYRKNTLFNKNSKLVFKLQLLNLDLPSDIPDKLDEIFNLIYDAYFQTKELTEQLEMEYAISKMTCFDLGCSDCCKVTYPLISYVEYLYMRKWLDKQSDELKNKIYDESRQVVELYELKFKKQLHFLVGDEIDVDKYNYYPDLTFQCPFLQDNKCSVHEARPFTCRAYGYSSKDSMRFNGCNYFSQQFRNSRELNNVTKVINVKSFRKFAGLVDKKLLGKKIMAPIPFWFAHTHKEVLEKVRSL